MPEKIIFLDVDGVLNYMSYRNKSTANIDPSKVEMLAYICTQTNAKVVITSSWRGSETYTPRIYYILFDILKEHHVPVLGDTNIVVKCLDANALFVDIREEDKAVITKSFDKLEAYKKKIGKCISKSMLQEFSKFSPKNILGL